MSRKKNIRVDFQNKKTELKILEITPRQTLLTKTLGFIHPHTNMFVKFDSELPEDFKMLLEKLRS